MADPTIQNQQPYMSDEEVKDLASKLKSPASQSLLQQMGKVANDPQFSATVPADTQATLKQALQDAKEAYNAKVNQNEWLDVAQTLGRAVAQFGAANAGMRGGNRADMSNLNMGHPIDYNSRSDRAFREYQQEIGNARDLDSLARQTSNDEQVRRKYELQRQQDFLDKGLRAATEGERFDTSEKNADRRIQYQTAAERQRMDQQDKRASEREAMSNKRLDVTDLTKQENDLKSKLEAARALANEAVNDDDLNKKSRDEMAKKYGPLAAKAGVDPNDLAAIGEQSKNSGIFGTGFFRSEDKKKKSELLNQQVIGPIKNMLDAIQARKQSILRGINPEPATTPAPIPDAAPAPAPSKDPKIQQYADQYKLSYDDAKKVLVGRGYKPAE